VALTNAQKRQLAINLLHKAGDLVEFFDEQCPDLAAEVSKEDAAAQLTLWLKNLPGADWDMRLPYPPS